jgi:hypothetical protein
MPRPHRGAKSKAGCGIRAILSGGCLLFILAAAKAQDGPVRLTAAISLAKKVVTLHEPAILDIAFENPSQRGVVVNLGYDDEKLGVVVTDPGGKVVKKPRRVKSGWATPDIFNVSRGESSVGLVALNTWFSFDKTGVYRIDVTLPPDSSPKEPFSYSIANNSATLDLTVLPRDGRSLESACADLVKMIEGSRSASESTAAAEALSSVDDPAVVPFLAQAMKRRGFTGMMIEALSRLKTDDAVKALILASRSGDQETRALAHSALVGLGKEPPQ